LAQCSAIKRDGTRCKGIAMEGYEWCYAHHPGYSKERRRNAHRGGKRGGRGRTKAGAAGLQDIKDLLRNLTDDVLSGEVERGVAIAANQLLNTSLRALELERRWKEIGELEGRLEALEGVLKGRPRAG
jgi:hypothetical protein